MFLNTALCSTHELLDLPATAEQAVPTAKGDQDILVNSHRGDVAVPEGRKVLHYELAVVLNLSNQKAALLDDARRQAPRQACPPNFRNGNALGV